MPSTSIEPPEGGKTPAKRFNTVVLPAPEGPIMPILDWGSISNEILLNALTFPKFIETEFKMNLPLIGLCTPAPFLSSSAFHISPTC